MGCFNDPAWKVCGWWGGWLTPTTYMQLTGAGSTAHWGWIKSEKENVASSSLVTSVNASMASTQELPKCV